MPALGPDIVNRQAVIGSCALSPDGELVVYTRRTVAGDEYRTDLWLVPYRGGRPRRLTSGAGNDASPVFSPDGGSVAFTSDRGEGDDSRLYLIRVDGGEAELVCGAHHGSVGQPVFSPDGRRIAFTGWAGPPRFWAGEPDRRMARVIRAVDWRDDTGEREYRTHLYVVDARPGARPRVVTQGDFDVADPEWHPDGSRIAFAANPDPRADLRPKTAIHEVALEDGATGELMRLRGTAGTPAWSPDGSTLAFLGTNVSGAPDYAEPELYVWKPGGRARSLTGRLDLPVTVAWCSDLHDWMHASGIPRPLWEGPDSLVVPVNRRGRDEVWRVPLRGQPEPISTGDTTLGGLAVGGGRVVSSLTDDVYPPEVCAVEEAGLRRLTRHGGAWLRSHTAPVVREVDANGIPSFLVEPAGAKGPGALVLSPHGGPYGAHGPTPELDSWLLAELGYRVGRAGTGRSGSVRSRAPGAGPTPTTC
jgi:Tol biopolymer transport system component